MQEFIEGQTFAAFVKDIKTQYAVRLSLAHIGEAVKRLPAELTEQHPHIPWRQIAGMRDRLVHGHATVDLRVVWRAASISVPELAVAVTGILDEETK